MEVITSNSSATARQRWGQLHHRVAPVVGAADQPGFVEGAGQEAPQQSLGLVVVEGLPGVLVLHHLDAVEVAGPTDVPHDGKVGEGVERGLELGLVLPHVLQEALLLEDVEVGQRNGRTDRMASEGDTVEEALALEERLHQPVAHRHGPERGVAAGQTLGHGHDVRLIPVALGTEVVAQPTEGTDHLIRDQQHAIPVADLAHPLEVARRRGEAAAGVLDRLEEDGRHRLGTLV